MKQKKIKGAVEVCLQEKRVCGILFRYDHYFSYYIPVAMNNTLFLGAKEDDFVLDGYSVRRFQDAVKARCKKVLHDDILKKEGVIEQVQPPNIDLTSWETVFRSLEKENRNIAVERESLHEKECEYIIGRIEKVGKKSIHIRHFDANGIWQNIPYRMSYKEITSVSFGNRYVEVFSKYLGALPENFAGNTAADRQPEVQ